MSPVAFETGLQESHSLEARHWPADNSVRWCPEWFWLRSFLTAAVLAEEKTERKGWEEAYRKQYSIDCAKWGKQLFPQLGCWGKLTQ